MLGANLSISLLQLYINDVGATIKVLEGRVDKIKEIVAEQLGIDESEIKMETNFIDDLGADSLDLFQVIMELEEEFDVKVEEVENIKTVKDAVEFIEKATN
ncbi:MAG: acyl carrier protein [Clostridium sp.]|nr:acyl carrier protein [Clostridium sp.]